ncbi:MAG: AAA family ATPase [Candidatus Aenigmarchaeota archaeon]|nr:AAA family ATPase [Candidatus Aenigmarchaeota archaeon]
MVERVATGIPGFDKSIQGGLLKGSSNLIVGGPGSGKSIFCMQFLVNGAKAGEPGLYVSFEEDEQQLVQNLSPFSWGLEDLAKQGKLVLKYFTPEHIDIFIKSSMDPLLDVVRQYNVRRVVIDSATAYQMMFDTDYKKRVHLLKLLDALKKYEATVLITTERGTSADEFELMDFLANGVIVLYNIRKGSERGRGIEILKMRSTKHSQRIMPMDIGSSGITVYPDASFYSDV